MNKVQYNNVIMEYQKMKSLLDKTPNELPMFRTKILIEINDQSRGTYTTNSNIRFKTRIIESMFM